MVRLLKINAHLRIFFILQQTDARILILLELSDWKLDLIWNLNEGWTVRINGITTNRYKKTTVNTHTPNIKLNEYDVEQKIKRPQTDRKGAILRFLVNCALCMQVLCSRCYHVDVWPLIFIVYTKTFFTRNLISMFIQFNIYAHTLRAISFALPSAYHVRCNFRCKFTLNLCTYRLNQVIWTSTYTIIPAQHSIAYAVNWQAVVIGRLVKKESCWHLRGTEIDMRSSSKCENVCMCVCAVLFKIIWS